MVMADGNFFLVDFGSRRGSSSNRKVIWTTIYTAEVCFRATNLYFLALNLTWTRSSAWLFVVFVSDRDVELIFLYSTSSWTVSFSTANGDVFSLHRTWALWSWSGPLSVFSNNDFLSFDFPRPRHGCSVRRAVSSTLADDKLAGS
jgi:hypothetical protein